MVSDRLDRLTVQLGALIGIMAGAILIFRVLALTGLLGLFLFSSWILMIGVVARFANHHAEFRW